LIIIVKVLYIIVSLLVLLLPLTYALPSILNYYPFYRNGLKALAKLHTLKEEKCVSFKGKIYKFKVSCVKEGDAGFKELLSTIETKRGPFTGRKIVEICLAVGDIPIEATMLSPNAIIYAAYFDEEGKEHWIPIVFYPFDPASTRELRDLTEWFKDFTYRKIALYTVVFVIIWTALTVLLIL